MPAHNTTWGLSGCNSWLLSQLELTWITWLSPPLSSCLLGLLGTLHKPIAVSYFCFYPFKTPRFKGSPCCCWTSRNTTLSSTQLCNLVQAPQRTGELMFIAVCSKHDELFIRLECNQHCRDNMTSAHVFNAVCVVIYSLFQKGQRLIQDLL